MKILCKQIPCLQCISLAICKHKRYHQLFDECTIIKKYIPNHRHRHIRNERKLKRLCKQMNPSKWEHDNGVLVIY